jgi:hypothetical protein
MAATENSCVAVSKQAWFMILKIHCSLPQLKHLVVTKKYHIKLWILTLADRASDFDISHELDG